MRRRNFYYSLIVVFLLCPVGGFAQTITKIFNNTTLKTVLKEVERQTKMSVIYKVDEVDGNKKISASFQKEPVEKVLSKILDPSLDYTIENKMITIHRRNAAPDSKKVQKNEKGQPRKIHGTVVDVNGEPLIGVAVRIKNSNVGAITDIDGNYNITTNETAPKLEFSYVGYAAQEVVASNNTMNITLKEESNQLNEVVVTAMGIQRKEKSLTYATQSVKSEDLMRVQDPNVVNSLEGKISGVVITPSAGGAGGASKIILRGNKSILGNSSPLIVVDGVPMSNGTRNQIGGTNLDYSGVTEGADPLSMINPDDIESMNVLKGANAAALYGSAAANGVVMITTKQGKEGKLSISVTSNITFDNPLLTPKIQNVYGARINVSGGLDLDSWGGKVSDLSADKLLLTTNFNSDSPFPKGATNQIHLRNKAKNDLDDFYRTGTTVNTSVSLSGGTEKIQNYFSFSNSHATGMLASNMYNRNTVNFRQAYHFFKRLHINTSVNYIQTITNNRPGGGTVMNPIYHMYTAPRNLDMDYYRNNYYRDNGAWMAKGVPAYVQQSGNVYEKTLIDLNFEGRMQEWAFLEKSQNNPYWLTKMNKTKYRTDRVFGTVSGKLDIYDGLDFQARISIDHTKYDNEGNRYATTFTPGGIDPYGIYFKNLDRTAEIYTDYLLSYNKTFNDTWSVSATAGWVGHLIKTKYHEVYTSATPKDGQMIKFSKLVNYFEANAATAGQTKESQNTNWDKAALFTAQIGWKDMVYFDASYRQDWYRAFRQFRDRGTSASYGYFGFGANAILSSIVKLPSFISYLKYRASYSEVGNSIPNKVLTKSYRDPFTGAVTPTMYSSFKNPKPEKTRSFETGIESSMFGSRLDFDFTFYRTLSTDQYMEGANASGKIEPVNSGKIRNSGIETTIGYNFKFGKDWRWKTSYNLSFNDNKILETTYNSDGSEKLVYQDVAEVRVRYKKGGSIGDMYVTDYKRNEDGTLAITKDGRVSYESEASKKFTVYAGNMNSKWQMGWSNTFNYKNFQLFFMINGRIGGKVISLTESYLDNLGLSQRTADARLYAEQHNLSVDGRLAMYLPDGSNRLVPIENYYSSMAGKKKSPIEYIYNATNFRLRELSAGYTFVNLLGANTSLNVSFIARNLFFLYKDAPVDPDISLSTGNGLGAFELFNMPSSRSYGLSVKLTL